MQRHVRLSSPLLTTLLALLLAAPLHAQLSTTLPVGSMIRWKEDGHRRQGTVERVDEEAGVIWVQRRGVDQAVSIPFTTPELALRTRKNGKGTAAITAFGLGFALGIAMGDDPPCRNTGWFSFCSSSTAAEKGMAIGGMGGLFGLLVGPRSKWELLADSVGKPADRVTAIIEPTRLGLRVAF